MLGNVSARDVNFILYEYLELGGVLSLPEFGQFTLGDLRSIADEAFTQSAKIVAPLNAPGDREGARFMKRTASVRVPKGYKEAHALYGKNGWISAGLPEKDGGLGLPRLISIACEEAFTAACPAFAMAPGLTRAAMNVIAKVGTDEQRARYVGKMSDGTWSGTMCLTEPHAGSDVGSARTKAVPVDGKPGFYKISGTKCFISFGEHDMTENIIHLVLARTPNAPKGTRGLGLFIVPKYKIADDGSSAKKKNDVACGGIEHKMGIHGSPTCTLNFGEKDSCEGELLGHVTSGMKYMFLMMNEARLLVGMQGAAIAAASYEVALRYAKERIQGADIREAQDPEAARVAIIAHADVRRMLMTMKALTEGMRALLYNIARYIDLAGHAPDEATRKKYSGWVELLTPVAKAYCSDTACDVAIMGMQVAGGAGYCADLPLEQYVRDVKITSIYEGANGIQALDLIGRKFPMENGAVLMSLASRMGTILEEIKEIADLSDLATMVECAASDFSDIVVPLLDKKNFNHALLHATDVLEILGTITSAFYLLEEAAVARKKLEALILAPGAEPEELKFYSSKIATARFFIANLLPKTSWRITAIAACDTSCLLDVL